MIVPPPPPIPQPAPPLPNEAPPPAVEVPVSFSHEHTIIDGDGEIVSVVTVPDDQHLELNTPEGCVSLEGRPSSFTAYYSNGAWIEKPAQPSPDMQWDRKNKVWHDPRSLDELKAAANAAINEARLNANQSGFTFRGKKIASDTLSRSDIDGVNGAVALTGELPASFPGGWKCEDNSFVAITDKETWVEFYAAMISQGTTNFLYAQALKTQLAAATTPEAVAACVWPE